MGSNLQSCPEVQPGAFGSGLRVAPAADQAVPSLRQAKHGCASGEEAEESTRLLTASQCQAAAFEGLLSMDYQKTSEARQLWGLLLAFISLLQWFMEDFTWRAFFACS